MDNGSAPPLRTELVDPAVQSLPFDAWERLYRADPEGHFFLSPIFLGSVFAEFPGSCRMLAAWDGRELVGLLPLRLATRRVDGAGFHTEFMTAGSHYWADYAGLLVQDGREPEVVAALAGALASLGWRSFRFKNLRASEARRAAFLRPFLESDNFAVRYEDGLTPDGDTDNLACPRLALPETFDEYLARLGPNTRQKIRRLLRMLDEGQFAVRAASGSDDVDRIVALWVKRWGAEKGARIDELEDDLRRILAAGLRRRCLSVPILEREGQVLGALANYVDTVRGEILFFLAVRDLEADRASTGLLLHAEAIRAAIGAGFRVYDFLRGDEPYKLQLGGVPERIHFPIITRVKAAAPQETLAAASARSVLRRVEDMLAEGDVSGASAAIAQLRAVL